MKNLEQKLAALRDNEPIKNLQDKLRKRLYPSSPAGLVAIKEDLRKVAVSSAEIVLYSLLKEVIFSELEWVYEYVYLLGGRLYKVSFQI